MTDGTLKHFPIPSRPLQAKRGRPTSHLFPEPAVRPKPPKGEAPRESWWLKHAAPDARESFQAAAKERAEKMQSDPKWKSHGNLSQLGDTRVPQIKRW